MPLSSEAYAANAKALDIFTRVEKDSGIDMLAQLDLLTEAITEDGKDAVILYGKCRVSAAIFAHRDPLQLDKYLVINNSKSRGDDGVPQETPEYFPKNGAPKTAGVAVLKMLMEAADMETTDEGVDRLMGCSRTVQAT